MHREPGPVPGRWSRMVAGREAGDGRKGKLGSVRPGAPGGCVPASSLCTTSEMLDLKSSCCIPLEEVICMTKSMNQLGRC